MLHPVTSFTILWLYIMKSALTRRREVFDMIEHYLKMGGGPNIPMVDRFCLEFDISKEQLIKAIKEGEAGWSALRAQLRQKDIL